MSIIANDCTPCNADAVSNTSSQNASNSATLAGRLYAFLQPMVDPVDWARDDGRGGRLVRETDDRLLKQHQLRRLRELGHPTVRVLQELDAALCQKHIERHDRLHYTLRRTGEAALVCIDVDAHEGQTDARDVAEFITDAVFPGAYVERSSRGYHVYIRVRVGRCRRKVFNEKMRDLAVVLSTLAAAMQYTSSVELLGEYTILAKRPAEKGRLRRTVECRARLAPLPRPSSAVAMDQLESGRVFGLHELPHRNDTTIPENTTGENQFPPTPTTPQPTYLPDDYPGIPKVGGTGTVLPHHPCAWVRMTRACFQYTVAFRRLPTVDELLGYYRQVYDTDEGTDARRRRAVYAVRYRAMTFDPAKAWSGGYERCRDRLLEAVKAHCTDRTSTYKGRVWDEDLAVALYAITQKSFTVHSELRQQWSCPDRMVLGMFKALKDAGVIRRGCKDPDKVSVLKRILTGSGLVQCVDGKWYHGGKGQGVGKKYVVGPAHWRYMEFVRFAEKVEWRRIGVREAELGVEAA